MLVDKKKKIKKKPLTKLELNIIINELNKHAKYQSR